MYSASANFITAIKSNVRRIHWSGSIDFDTPITFDDENILSGSITKTISGNNISIGTVYASQLSMDIILESVSRYELYGKNITISVSIDGASDVILMGVFAVTEAMQTADHISIKAYDNMVKFDNVAFVPSSHLSIQKAYDWLVEACTACGVTLGSTSGDIALLPNGSRKTGFSNCVSDVKTWRDVLRYLTAFLGGYAYIGRDGKLYVGTYGSTSADTIPSSFRYFSKLSDFRTTYDGLYAIYKNEGVQEYVSNTNVGGIVLNLGTNPFLQFSDSINRQNALQEIIDAWNGVYYVPYSAEMPLVPIYDAGDVLTFTDNQAGAYDIGAITEITYNISGTMSVTCTGDNPRLADAQDRVSKSVAGLSKDYNSGAESGGKSFWLLHTENTSTLIIGSTKTEVAEIQWNQTVDVQRLGLMFSCEASLSVTETVDVLLTVDDLIDYSFEVTEEKALAGKRIFTVDCGFRVTGKGTHTAKVYLTVTDTPTIWSDLV